MASWSDLPSVLGIVFFIQNEYTSLKTTFGSELNGTKTF